jgi:hypothetical protein
MNNMPNFKLLHESKNEETKYELAFNNLTMKNMIRMMQIVNNGPKARKAHLL